MVHLQIFDAPGALRLAGVPVIGKCLIQVYLKQKRSKCAKLLNAVRIAGCCGAAGGVYSHPPLSCNQIAGECQPIRHHLSFRIYRSLAMRCSFPCRNGRVAPREAASCGRCPIVPAKLHTRPNTASRAGLRFYGDFPIQAGKAAFGIGQPVPLRSAVENAQHVRFFQVDRIRKTVI